MSSLRFRSLKWLAWLFVISLVLLLIVMPIVSSALIRNDLIPPRFSKVLDFCIQLQAFALGLFAISWIFFFGSCFASFLNVVAWRVPRGRSILGSSHCPYCNSKLKFRDNLPVVGWLKNGGRCRTCRLPISLRYLLAELILGAIFLLLAIVILNGGGISLPFRPTDRFRGFENLLFDPKWDLLLLLFFHLTLLSCLFTFSLIKSDGLFAPASLILAAFLLGILLPLVWPEMSLVNWRNGYEASHGNRWTVLTTSAIGATAGLIVGWVLGQLQNPADQMKKNVFEFSCGLSIIGVFLGWQSVLSVCGFYLAIRCSMDALKPCRMLPASISRLLSENDFAVLTCATLIHLLSWRAQTKIPFWMNADRPLGTLILGFISISVLAFLASRISSQSDTEQQSLA